MYTVIMRENLNNVHLKRQTLEYPKQKVFEHSFVIIG